MFVVIVGSSDERQMCGFFSMSLDVYKRQVLEGGEHWFHTPEQLAALHRWESDVLEQMK